MSDLPASHRVIRRPSGDEPSPAGSTSAGSTSRVVEHVTCLGCGCTCDDIRVTIVPEVEAAIAGGSVTRAARITHAANACPIGIEWFGNGAVPTRAAVQGADAAVEDALDAVASMLRAARRPLVYLAPDLSCESQRIGVELADRLHAVLDSVTSSTSLAGILAAQERGTATVSLGEVRNRADVVIFWGVDPAARYPRYASRYAPDPVGRFLPDGRRSRTVISVDVGRSQGPADADVRVAVGPAEEVAVLTALAAAVTGLGPAADAVDPTSPWGLAHTIAPRLRGARYAAIVIDGEPPDGDGHTGRVSLARASALIALAHALNGVVRCGVSTLRAGGNRPGADGVLTGRTGFPCAVDFSAGVPVYDPYARTAEACLARGEIDTALLLGSTALLPVTIRTLLERVPLAAIGPRASTSALVPGTYVDTGVPGIHETGTAIRMDDVPLPLTAVIAGAPTQTAVLRALADRLPARR